MSQNVAPIEVSWIYSIEVVVLYKLKFYFSAKIFLNFSDNLSSSDIVS